MTHVTHVSACCAIPSRLRFNVGAPGLCLTAHSTVVAGQRIRDAPHLWQGPRGVLPAIVRGSGPHYAPPRPLLVLRLTVLRAETGHEQRRDGQSRRGTRQPRIRRSAR